MNNYFSTNLKFIRENLGLSQSALAKKIGVNQTTIARWEDDNRTPTIDNALDVSEVLNVPLPELLGIDLRIGKKEVENNEYDDKLKKLATDNGVEISYSKSAPLTEEDFAQVSKILLEEIQKEEKK